MEEHKVLQHWVTNYNRDENSSLRCISFIAQRRCIVEAVDDVLLMKNNANSRALKCFSRCASLNSLSSNRCCLQCRFKRSARRFGTPERTSRTSSALQSREISIDTRRKAGRQLFIQTLNHKCNFSLIADANGLIMGEFGFITADDVYHVTVYATDENGNFKVISMKNIKLMKGLPPQDFARNSPMTTSTTPQPFMVRTTATSDLATPRSTDEASCASCRLPAKPETETINPALSTVPSTDVPPPFKVVTTDEDKVPTETTTAPPAENLPQKIVNQKPGNTLQRSGNAGGNGNSNQQQKFNAYQLQTNNNNNQLQNVNNNQLRGLPVDQTLPLNVRQPALNEKLDSPKFFNKNAGNVDHYNKMENMMNGLLYRFNYTTDFQGHREEGDRAGNKDGEYFSVGRDNIKRVVSYKANQFGFMPFIRQEPISSQDERNNRLRGYNFEWFYP